MPSDLALSQRGFQGPLTVGVAPVPLTKPSGLLPRHAFIYVANNPIRWRADVNDTAPTATVGIFVAANSYIDWTDADKDYQSMIDHVRFIADATATGDAKLDIAYFN